MKEKKGISLIVTVITIIVMIIVAGAVILTLTGTKRSKPREVLMSKERWQELNMTTHTEEE